MKILLAAIVIFLTNASVSNAQLDPNTSSFTKWNKAVKEIPAEIYPIKEEEKLSVLLDMVSKYREYSYLEDRGFFGKNDTWKTPAEFLKDRGGDCEDFVISQYDYLIKRGFQDHDLRLVVGHLRDTGETHAVLAVWIKNTWLIVDSSRELGIQPYSFLKTEMEKYYEINREGWHD